MQTMASAITMMMSMRVSEIMVFTSAIDSPEREALDPTPT